MEKQVSQVRKYSDEIYGILQKVSSLISTYFHSVTVHSKF